ncbi:alpha-galactosidase [Deinococcus sp.]|uniref:alpha-galactosidase n=1 Tax=Deinococcus sp. TaxID=47478 RepID=UPI003CC561AF
MTTPQQPSTEQPNRPVRPESSSLSAEILDLDGFWILKTALSAYALGVNPAGDLVSTYWGEPLPDPADYPRPQTPAEWASFNHPANLTAYEYPVPGGAKYSECAVHLSFPGGQRDLRLKLLDAQVGPHTLTLRLRDETLEFGVSLHYRLDAERSLVIRFAELHNASAAPVQLGRAFSAALPLPAGHGYALTHLEGRWFDEFRIRREAFAHGTLTLESRRLTTGHDGAPFFMVDRYDPAEAASETRGGVWFGTLAWSGNWKLIAERTRFGRSAVHLGVNDHDFGWTLAAGETFQTPEVTFGYSAQGFGGASRRLHDHARQALFPHGDQARPVLYNSWEATYFDVEEASQVELAEVAAGLGVELFVVDDGWFHGRKSDTAGLGDWWPDEHKFPQGLTPLIERVGALGMGFGLWIEPEMVNPDSELYRAHPDWVLYSPGREPLLMRDQLILNLARVDVQEHLIATFGALLSKHDIRFIKWDMNRSVSDPGWPGHDPARDARELWVRYVQGLYRIWDTLRSRHPAVLWQTCSGGGGRVDFGMFARADQAWPSDNTSAPARLSIQEGYTLAYPPISMEAWVTDRRGGQVPLAFRFHVSMAGSLGIGGDIRRWTAAEQEQARELVSVYKEIRPIVQAGELYRLRSPSQHAYSAVQYLSKDQAQGVLIAYHTHTAREHDAPPLYLQGLLPTERYELEGCGVRTGEGWRLGGVTLPLGEFESTLRRIRRVDL